MGFLAVVEGCGAFGWGNPRKGFLIVCARMSALTALCLFSYILFEYLGYPLQICPREGLPFPGCFHVCLVYLFPVSLPL